MAPPLKRKAPRRPALNDIFVKRSTPFPVYLRRAEALFERRETVVVIHGLGAAILLAVRLANTLQNKYPSMEAQVHTATQQVLDEKEGEATPSRRSAVHIRLSYNMYE